MNHPKTAKNLKLLKSFVTVRRESWILKVSTLHANSNYTICLVGSNIVTDDFLVRFFSNADEAVNFIDLIVKEDYDNSGIQDS